MVSLREIPREKLDEIRRFLIQKKDKHVTREQLAEEVKKRFGIELKPDQVSRLLMPRSKKVSLPEDVLKMIEEEYGDVREGLKNLMRIARMTLKPPPEYYRKALSQLHGRKLEWWEAVRELKEMGYDDPEKAIDYLVKNGYCWRTEDGKLEFSRHPRPPELMLLGFLGGISVGGGRKRAKSQGSQAYR